MAKANKQPKRPYPSTPVALERKMMEAAGMLKRGQANEVLAGLEQIATKVPRDHRVWDLLTSTHCTLGRHREAMICGAKAVELCPDSPEVRMRYGMALQQGGKYEEAILEFERALYRKPNDLQLMRCKLACYTDTADHENALRVIKEIEQAAKEQGVSGKDLGGFVLSKARLSPKLIPAREVIDELDPIAHDESSDPHFKEIAFHQLGRLYETLGEYDTAFDRFTKCNEARKPEWDPDVFSAYVDKLIKCWERIDTVPESRVPGGERLIFITGMMRSGTSLTEQMIAQLPGVTPGGEMNSVSRAVVNYESLPNPTKVGRPFPVSRLVYNQRVMDSMSKSAWFYYNEVAKEGRITDKLPHNIFYAPIIARMFPGCKIIHCKRDAMDNCLSNFVQTYARNHPQTHDLYWLGRYHKDYQRMARAWAELDEINLYDLQYEDLVDHPEEETKKLCAYLGLEWSESMLSFHDSDRTVRTASRDQVRKPLYKSSVKKHERYDAHLGELKRGLGLES